MKYLSDLLYIFPIFFHFGFFLKSHIATLIHTLLIIKMIWIPGSTDGS